MKTALLVKTWLKAIAPRHKLRSRSMTVTEVARRVGYVHLGHFAAAFKRNGITPSDEIVSPGSTNRTHDYRYKRTEYAARGIAEYWIIDPEERRITVCEWVDRQYEDKVFAGETQIDSTVIPAFELTAEQIFAFAQN